MSECDPRSPNETKAEMIVRMFPTDANPAGNVFGGVILRNIDSVAGLVAQRHCRTNAVTVSMDKVTFLKPAYVGNALVLNARINYVHKSSLEIEIKVETEDMEKGTRTVTGTAFVTFVALDKNGKPTPIPKLKLETEEDKRKFEEGKMRMEKRIEERNKKKLQ